MLSSHSRKSFVNTKNVCLQVFAKRGYYELAEKPQDAEKPFPWRSVRLKQDEKTPHPLHVAVYNPKGTSLRPPMPIIMLPGLTSNYKVFSAICRKMNYPYGVLAMDLRGRGMSQVRSDEKQPDQYPSSLLEYALDVTRVLKFFHLYKAFIVGYDIGGLIGLLAAKHFPERVSGLVLINSGIPKTSDILPPHIRKGYEKELELLSQNSGDIASYVQQWEKSQNVASLSNDTKEQLSFDFKKEKDTTNLKPRTNIALAKHDMDRIAKDSLRLDQMFNIRHPVALVRSQQGFAPDASPLIDSKLASELEKTLNVKSEYVADNATHYSLMWNDQHTSKIAQTIDNLVGQYDVHRKIEVRFDALKEKEVKLDDTAATTAPTNKGCQT